MEKGITRILEGNRAKKTVIQKKLGLLFEIGKDICHTLKSGHRVWLLATPSRQPLTTILAGFFRTLAPEDLPCPAVLPVPLGAYLDLEGNTSYHQAILSSCKKNDTLLVLVGGESDELLQKEVAAASRRGVWTIVMTGRLAKKGWKTKATRVLNLCTESDIALLEMQLVFGYLIAEYVAEKFAGGHDPLIGADGLAHDSEGVAPIPVETARIGQDRLADLSLAGQRFTITSAESGRIEKVDAESAHQAIRFHCEHCGELVFAETRHRGREGRCPKCGSKFRVPEVDSEILVSTGVVERRRTPRFSVTECTVQFARDHFPSASSYTAEYALKDLSEGGLQFMKESAVPGDPGMESGEKIFLSVDVPAFLEPLRLKGVVARIIGNEERTSWSISVKFDDFLDEARAKLKRLTENILLRDIART